MYTCCPECNVIFHIGTAHLAKAAGRVRCGECRHVYCALDYLFDELEDARSAAAEALAERRTGDQPLVSGPEYSQEIVLESLPLDENEAALADEREAPPASALPGTGRSWQAPVITGSYLFGLAVVIVLLAGLGGQWLYFNRVSLSEGPRLRPALELFCSVLDCELPLRRDPALLKVVHRDVRQHPGVTGALLINTSFENSAAFAQPYPVFEISFTDERGNPVAGRRFQPEEYANGRLVTQGIAPGAKVDVVLEVFDPGTDAISYQFDFL